LDRLLGKDRARESNPAPPESGNPVTSDENARSQETIIALLAPDEVFTARLHSSMPAEQRALLRFAEQGRLYLQAGDPAKALRFLEKALGIGATQYLPYIYYYLAQSHFRLANYQAAREFRGVAEAWLGEFPDWQLEIARLEQKSFSAREIS
jgi:tetratricopeptide (TPR) repeat protein